MDKKTDVFQHNILEQLQNVNASSTPTIDADAAIALPALNKMRLRQLALKQQHEALLHAYIALEASRDRYVDLFDSAPIGYVTLSVEGMITEINLTATKMLEVTRKSVMLDKFVQFIDKQDQSRWHHQFMNAILDAETKARNLDFLVKRGDGTSFKAHIGYFSSKNEIGVPTLNVTITDISHVKHPDTLRIATTAIEPQESILITNADKVILEVNDTFTKVTGYHAEEVIGKTPAFLRSGYHDDPFYKSIWEKVTNTGSWQGEAWSRRKNGEIYPGWITITAVQVGDNINTLHYVATLSDNTEQKASVEKIEQLAFYDPLTNLPNRRLLKDRLQRALSYSARSKRQGALLFIDLDNFKSLNDTLGHNMGDLLLQQVAYRLLASLRASDTAARLGGDEFVVMLEDLGEHPEEATLYVEIVGNKILSALNQPYELAGHHYCCSSSIGASLFNGFSATEDDLLKHVDIAMYQAKQSGKNSLCFFDQAMQTLLIKHVALETDLRFALEKNQFKLEYQMQIAHDGQIVGAEVLIRWHHPVHGTMLPVEFIPLAEKIGLILPIGLWALEMACEQLKRWSSDHNTQHLQLAVNISARQLHQIDFVEQILDIIEKKSIPPHCLKLELTESIVLYDIADTIKKMHALKFHGVQFSLDDFGTGYSSLSYLTQLPFDQLKIDQSFVSNLDIKHTDRVIIQTIIDMTNNLNMEVIAEGVETETQRAFLNQHGCKLYQGFLFSKPVPLLEFEQLLLKKSII